MFIHEHLLNAKLNQKIVEKKSNEAWKFFKRTELETKPLRNNQGSSKQKCCTIVCQA